MTTTLYQLLSSMLLFVVVVLVLFDEVAVVVNGFTYSIGSPKATRTQRYLSLLPKTTKSSHHASTSSSTSVNSQLPTIEQLSNDKFMDQVQYGSQIVSLLMMEGSSSEENDDQEDDDKKQQQHLLTQMISAQLSHSDGIRGFFVSYLTSDTTTSDDNGDNDDTAVVHHHPADNNDEILPKPLQNAIRQQLLENLSDEKSIVDELISLICMNVIMPTAMISMHTNPKLSASSAITSKRGINVAKFVLSMTTQNELMKQQCNAIFNVATTRSKSTTKEEDNENDDDDVDVKYWSEFFNKWGYGSKQKDDIAKAIKDVLS